MKKFNETEHKNEKDMWNEETEMKRLLIEADHFKKLAFWGLFVCTGSSAIKPGISFLDTLEIRYASI